MSPNPDSTAEQKFIPCVNPPVDEPRVFFSGWFLREIANGVWPFWSMDAKLVKLASDTRVRVWRLTGHQIRPDHYATSGDIGHEAVWPD